MKIQNNLLWLVAATCALLAGCQNDLAESDRDIPKNRLAIQVMMDEQLWSTKPGDTRSGQSFYEDGQLLLTVDQSQYTTGADSASTRGSISLAENISALTMVLFNTGANDFPNGGRVPTERFVATRQGSAAKAVFSLEPEYEWDLGNSDKLTFLAFTPQVVAENGLAFDPAVDGQSLTYTTPSDVAKQPDLCYAATPNISSMGASNLLTLGMKHALTAIQFSAVGFDVKITDIQIWGVHSKGKLNMADGTWSEFADRVTAEKCFRPQLKKDEWLERTSKNIIESNGYLMMVPQELSEDAKLKITYEGRKESSRGEFEVKLKDILPKWERGKMLNYRIRLEVAPIVENDQLIINDYRSGWCSDQVALAAMEPDEEVTFTWEASWLRMAEGPLPKPGGQDCYTDPANGFSSGYQLTSNKPIYFLAANDNLSASNRTAVVTAVGKRSHKKTFTVTQRPPWDIIVSTDNYFIDNFRDKQRDNALKVEVTGMDASRYWLNRTVTAQGLGKSPYDQNWFSVYSGSQPNMYTIDFKLNIQPMTRTGTVKFEITYNNLTKSKTVEVTQMAAPGWMKNDRDGYEVHDQRLGLLTYTGQILTEEGFKSVIDNYVRTGWWINNGNFVSNTDYWIWQESAWEMTFANSYFVFWYSDFSKYIKGKSWLGSHKKKRLRVPIRVNDVYD